MSTHSERQNRRQNPRPISPLIDMSDPMRHVTDAFARMKLLDGMRLQDVEDRAPATAKSRAAEITRTIDFLADELEFAAALARMQKWAGKGFVPKTDGFAS